MKHLLLSTLICISLNAMSQLNMTQLGYIDIPDSHTTVCNDIWGYEDEAGNEYALVGTEDGVSVVDVTDPGNLEEVSWIPGLNSIWRDIKVYGDYAYATTEADEGLTIIDLSPLPSSTILSSSIYNGPTGSEWFSAHNIYEDNGFVYIFGAGRGNGGVIILDVATDPLNPIEVGTFDMWYAHDGVVRNDTGYFAHINDGFFSIVDLTDKANPVFLGSSITPSTFTHNIWTSSDGDYAFTTDEVSGGYLASFDVSDPSNILALDKIQSSPGEEIMPHNSHVLGDYLVTSYYADGVIVHDITHPHNMVEVGNFDTSPLNTSGSVGCWGAYPFLSSGNILGTDRQEGLFVIGSSLHQGAYLEGNITEFGTSNPLNNVEVTIDGENIQDFSGVIGDYATGIEATGTYDVTYFKILYFPQTISTPLTEGNIVIQDVELTKIPQYNITVTVLDAQTLLPIENAEVILEHTYISHEGTTDINGELVVGLYYQDNYDVTAGKWEMKNDCFADTLLDNMSSGITLYLDQGIYDDFSLDFGWTVFGDATKGMWTREIPVGVDAGGTIENPFTDAPWDCGNKTFVTGNGSTAGNTDEVGGGETTLASPLFDLSGYSSPYVNFNVFYYNMFGPFYPADTLFVTMFNGTETVSIAKIHKDNINMNQWVPKSYEVPAGFTLTANMQLFVNISDYNATISICEAAFDHFSITDFSMVSIEEEVEEILFYPNPVSNVLIFKSGLLGRFEIFDLEGKSIKEGVISPSISVNELSAGMYIIQLQDSEGKLIAHSKLFKY
ncbi:MAG: choice-of-anchor B domain-containing protein [Arenicella sp.]|jgi:choice-of-anchor B domain-containing protein